MASYKIQRKQTTQILILQLIYVNPIFMYSLFFEGFMYSLFFEGFTLFVFHNSPTSSVFIRPLDVIAYLNSPITYVCNRTDTVTGEDGREENLR
jgi:hypothetical protein